MICRRLTATIDDYSRYVGYNSLISEESASIIVHMQTACGLDRFAPYSYTI
jgi:hypothetical protein